MRIWATVVGGVVLVVLTLRYLAIWWTLLLWLVAAGVVVGDARNRESGRQ